jgi:hypothetical protein
LATPLGKNILDWIEMAKHGITNPEEVHTENIIQTIYDELFED